ncbi:hypothetical protein LB506_001114 [Fusarium annulatum]|nr:hypothetical protein LB506_001114 [Fusarium annulatum]
MFRAYQTLMQVSFDHMKQNWTHILAGISMQLSRLPSQEAIGFKIAGPQSILMDFLRIEL